MGRLPRLSLHGVAESLLLALCLSLTDAYADLEVVVEPNPARASAGEEVRLSVRLVNTGSEKRVVPLPGDGSAWGWRTPRTGWSIISKLEPNIPHPEATPKRSDRRLCGNLNPYTVDDYVVIPPGGSVALSSSYLWGPTIEEPGEYVLRFYYEHVPELLDDRWLSRDNGVLDPLRLQSTAFQAISSDVHVVVSEREERPKRCARGPRRTKCAIVSVLSDGS
ncbi:hypothetical protein ABI59_04495 [Acidobacteria bacterium Mor1]|nr:hypothetical protein ABI59_04495 [Acidobacteria bacterium Mor1]